MAIAFVQQNSKQQDPSHSSDTATFSSAQTAANLNLVCVGWNSDTIDVSTVADVQGNTYALAKKQVSSGNGTCSLYYAMNIAAALAGVNIVTVTWASAILSSDIRILEYSGLATTGALHTTGGAAGSVSGGASMSAGNVTTTLNNCLIVAGDQVQNDGYTAGAGFTARMRTTFDQTVEDQITSATGTFAVAITNTLGGGWFTIPVAVFGDTPTGGGSVSDVIASAAERTRRNTLLRM